jgi:threonine dehydrogenase-like Zn-dependent dehydrogenase
MAPLSGKKVLVLGGSSGIGFGVARAALAEGAHVVIASSSSAKLAAAAERLGGGENVQSFVVDVASEDSFEALFAEIGTVEHLVFTVRTNQRPLDSTYTPRRPGVRSLGDCPRCSRTSSCPAQSTSSTCATGVSCVLRVVCTSLIDPRRRARGQVRSEGLRDRVVHLHVRLRRRRPRPALLRHGRRVRRARGDDARAGT